MGLIEATVEAAKLRLRPIVMTSLAFGFGVLPLAIATGAGAGAQKAIGTSVLGGMITATFLAIFFIPLFYVVVVRIFGQKKAVKLRRRPEPRAHRRDSNMHRKLLLVGNGPAACAGAHAPQTYKRPEPPVPTAWPESAPDQAGADAPAAGDVKWREFFTDPRLQSVIELALANNRDLRVATLNVERVEGFYRIQRAERYPTVNAAASAEVYRIPGECHRPGTRRRSRNIHQSGRRVLGTGPVRPDPKPEERGAGTVPGDAAGPVGDADIAGRRRRQHISGAGRRSGEPAAGPGDASMRSGVVRLDPADARLGIAPTSTCARRRARWRRRGWISPGTPARWRWTKTR